MFERITPDGRESETIGSGAGPSRPLFFFQEDRVPISDATAEGDRIGAVWGPFPVENDGTVASAANVRYDALSDGRCTGEAERMLRQQRAGMVFDPDMFLTHYADAFNGRNLEKLREFLALDDPRFAVFEDISEKLFNGDSYGAVLEGAFDATGEMSFELLRCDRFGDFAIIHAIQKILDEDGEGDGVFVEARFRTTMWVVFSGGTARVVAAHFSFPPVTAEVACAQGMCTA
ncbi:MAG TPA: hypothetical protein VLA34_00845 [Candidatus Krumholzibacterium sp.]|nr:hypothetical protein [Candidatus Krumholzibacterium sp.]